MLGIIDLAALSIIYVKVVQGINEFGSFGKEEIEFWIERK